MNYKLASLIKKAQKKVCGKGNYPVLSITKNNGVILQSERFKKQIASVDQSKYLVVDRGQLVLSIHLDEGVLGIQDVVETGIVSPAYKIWDINTDLVISKYLELVLKTEKSIDYYKSKAQSSVAGRCNIGDKDLLQMEVDIPSLEEQNQALKMIERVNCILSNIKNELQFLDDLIKARFVEMFGMPVTNNKAWETELMENVAPAVNYTGHFNNHVWLLNLDMVEAQTGRILDHLIVSEDEVGNSTCTFDTSNVLYSKLRPYLNKVVIPDRSGYATSELVPLQPVVTKLTREYLAFMLRSDEFVNMINDKVAGAKMPRVSMNDFRRFEVPIPPLELQKQFSAFVAQVDKSKFAVQKALDEAQLLFDSLMQKYFG